MKTNNILFPIFVIFTCVIFLIACQPNSTTQNEEKNVQEKQIDDHQLPIEDAKTLVLPYTVELNDQSQELDIKPNPQRSKVPLTQDELAEALNIKYPEIEINVRELRQDTLQVEIADASYLTQQNGTTGAMAYLAEATFAFTEIAAIKVVNFHFKEGDHAIPGPYTRKSFKIL